MGLQSPALEAKIYRIRISGSKYYQNRWVWPKPIKQKAMPVRSLVRDEGSGRIHHLAGSRLWHYGVPACPNGKWSGVAIPTWFGWKLTSGKDSPGGSKAEKPVV